jgi:hypothetical protein
MTAPICTGKAEVSLHEEGHILIRVYENSDVDLQDIRAIHEAKAKFAAGKNHTVIFCTPMMGNITRAAREFSASVECNENAIGKAIVAKSVAMLLIGNFFVKFHKPPAPTRVFNCEVEANKWLKELVEAIRR